MPSTGLADNGEGCRLATRCSEAAAFGRGWPWSIEDPKAAGECSWPTPEPIRRVLKPPKSAASRAARSRNGSKSGSATDGLANPTRQAHELAVGCACTLRGGHKVIEDGGKGRLVVDPALIHRPHGLVQVHAHAAKLIDQLLDQGTQFRVRRHRQTRCRAHQTAHDL